MNQICNESLDVAKLDCFQTLFHGRDDLWARRFVSRKSGAVGYAPACANEWRVGVCDKPKANCSTCRNRAFLPVERQLFRAHLGGLADSRGRPFALALYPLRPGDTCRFAGVTIPRSANSLQTAISIAATAERLGVRAVVEQCGFNEGYRLWWFFAEDVPASSARELVAFVITSAMRTNSQIGLGIYNEIYPSQSMLPKIGLGCSIPLPLQGAECKCGRAALLDSNGTGIDDVWRALSSVHRITRVELETILQRPRREGRVLCALRADEKSADFLSHETTAFSAEEFHTQVALSPDGIHGVLDNRVKLRLYELSPAFMFHLISLSSFLNTEFDKANAMRTSVYGIPRIISCAEIVNGFISLPRGCREAVERMADCIGVPVRWDDARAKGSIEGVEFNGKLRAAQEEAVKALLPHETGVLAAGTAFGKTVLAAWMIAKRAVPTLVIVNRRQLQSQWIERLSAFLSLDPKSIGRIGGGGRHKITGKIDVAIVQALQREGDESIDAILGRYGFVIIDECHGLPAPSFSRIVNRTKATYILGLSATPVRRDGHQPILTMQCGPVRHRIDPSALARQEPFEHIAFVRPTRFRPSLGLEMATIGNAMVPFSSLQDEIAADESRNAFIVGDVMDSLRDGRSPVVLTDRRAHLDTLADSLEEAGAKNVIRLMGGMGRRKLEKLRALIASIPDGEQRVLVATGPFIGEGFDDSRLDTLFLAMPISWKGRIAQYAGRLHRLHDGKREVRIYDYADMSVKTLERMFNRRCEGYEAIGYRIVMPASQLPGWPREVALPIEPRWHETYGESMRRMCRDGVDVALAESFVAAAWRDIPDDVEGVVRARSSAEAFLWRRLESLPQTKGCFVLNGIVKAEFGPTNEIEVDLFSESFHLAIEVDGPLHFRKDDDYRRDRRKDRLLQMHGLRVLRFLANDVTSRLGDVLDAISDFLRSNR